MSVTVVIVVHPCDWHRAMIEFCSDVKIAGRIEDAPAAIRRLVTWEPSLTNADRIDGARVETDPTIEPGAFALRFWGRERRGRFTELRDIVENGAPTTRMEEPTS